LTLSTTWLRSQLNRRTVHRLQFESIAHVFKSSRDGHRHLGLLTLRHGQGIHGRVAKTGARLPMPHRLLFCHAAGFGLSIASFAGSRH
jgi:hypothetical protein